MEEKKFTYDDLFALVPAVTVPEGVKIMGVINGLQRKLEEARTEAERLRMEIETPKVEKLAEKPSEPTEPNELTKSQIAAMGELIGDSWFPGLSVRLQNALENAGFLYIWQLAEKTKQEMLCRKGIGPGSIAPIKGLLAHYGIGLTLGMKFDRTIFTDPPSTSH